MKCFGPSRRSAVSKYQIAGADIDRANADTHFARVQPVEVDESFQRLLQWCCVVEACCGISRERRPER
jgi:F420-0:gamma-glutamyl ligase